MNPTNPQATFLSSLLKPKISLASSNTTAMSTPATSTKISSTVTPSNPSSTALTPTPNGTTTSTPNRDTYIASLRTAPGSPEAAAAQQAKDMATFFPNGVTSTGSATITNPTGTSTGTPPPSSSTTIGTASTPLSEYLKQYSANQKLLTDARNPNSDAYRQMNTVSQSLADVNSEIEKKRLQQRRDVDSTLDASGGTVQGAREAAALVSRRSNAELADLAVQANAYANTLNALKGNVEAQVEYAQSLIDAGKAIQVGDSLVDPNTGTVIYSKPKEGFSLSQGQDRYEFDPNTGQYKLVASVAPKTTASDSEVLSIAEAKTLGVPYGTTRLQAQTMGKVPGVASDTANGIKSNALQSANDLLTKFDNGQGTSAVGGSRIFGLQYLPGTAPKDFQIQFDNLKSLLSLDNVNLLKGQGAVSDAERQLLAQASAKLELAQSESEFRKSLVDIINALSGKVNPGSTGTTGGGSIIEYNGHRYQTDADGNFDPNQPLQ